MKCGKAAGTYLIVADILKASIVEDTQQIRYIIEDIIHFGKIPSDWGSIPDGSHPYSRNLSNPV